MGLSSNSIVHFTNSKEALKGILSENFKLKYCREEIPLNNKSLVIHVPMVSFCDIPFSQVHKHIDSYGCYGIGLTREWAIRNRLNPVIYIQNGSILAQSYLEAVSYFHSERQEEITKDRALAEDQLWEVFRYAKPYEGPLLLKTGKKIDSYRFSDEREWRYVPPISAGCKQFFFPENFHDSDERYNSEIHLARLNLKFDPNDVKYIVIKNDDEIHELIRHLDDVKGEKYSKRDVELLTTRIITAEQIRTDF